VEAHIISFGPPRVFEGVNHTASATLQFIAILCTDGIRRLLILIYG
jgi:hypothetical protein